MHDINTAISASLKHLEQELAGIRTGRANPAIVEELMVACYGTNTPLQQLAAISAPEPRMLIIQPWDPSIVKDIEKAINQSSIGINPVVDGKIIRLPFPTMTEERRKQLIKIVHEQAEASRVAVRNIREEIMKDVKKRETEGQVSEDAAKIEMKQIQNTIDEANEKITQMVKTKEDEVMTI